MSRNIELRHLRYFVAMAWPIGFTIKRAPSDESKKARRSGGQEFQGGSAPQPSAMTLFFDSAAGAKIVRLPSSASPARSKPQPRAFSVPMESERGSSFLF
jgi:hypothetical protein